MNPLQGLLHLLSDPNIAFILFTIGVYGLLFELQNPNFVTGILGALAIILAFIGFGSLPLNLAGPAADRAGRRPVRPRADRHQPRPARDRRDRLLRAGRVCAVHDAGRPDRARSSRVALPLIVTSTATTAVLMGLITLAAIRTRRMAPPAGHGRQPPCRWARAASSRRRSSRSARSIVAGEEWTARTADDRPLARDTPVRVVGSTA